QSFTLVNPGTAPLTYTLNTNAPWVLCSDPAGGALAGPGTNTIAVSYAPTTGWTPGISNATITIASTNGGGATQTVAIVMNVTGLLPPSVVTASKGTYSDKVRVTWDLVANATAYQVWRNTANSTATATNLTTTASAIYDDTAVTPEVIYYYWIRSSNNLGISAFSSPDTGYRNLYAPVGLTASKGTYTDKVVLSWTASAGAVGYEIWRNTSSDTSTAVRISIPDVAGTSYADTGATNAMLYTYWVKAKGVSGAISAFSDPDTGWRAVPSPTVSASKGLRREVKVTWSVSPGATSYELWKNTINESSSAKLLASGSETLYRDMQVIPGSHYYYWVKALCTLGDSGLGTSSEGWCGTGKWDFNGDGRAEPWYYHEDSGRWYVMMTTNIVSTIVLGGAGWEAVPADYDADGKADLAVYNRGAWQLMLSGSSYELVTASDFGGAGYVAAVADYDGDGKADPAVYAQASGTWLIAMSGNDYQLKTAYGFGMPGYQAVPADYDGDGKADPAIYEEASGNWFMSLSGNDYQINYVLHFGESGFTPVPGEYDGWGYAQIAVYQETSGNWYIRTGPEEYNMVYFGQLGYVPMPADYDGDKYEDEGVFYRDRYDATWFLLRSTEGFKMISGRDSRP
ncbi:MAG: FG-GAP-like repeat-containing protein, partial [Kiritimatiellaeota bacterium]|nr:FG-GAP-like repeat-containing protein [Kiritimatiellota bacterium]